MLDDGQKNVPVEMEPRKYNKITNKLNFLKIYLPLGLTIAIAAIASINLFLFDTNCYRSYPKSEDLSAQKCKISSLRFYLKILCLRIMHFFSRLHNI